MSFDFISIDKYSKTPLYEQLKTSILSALNNGHLKPGDKLPTEEAICKMFGVSRVVVKQAYNDLLNDGRIKRERGRGTFVKEIDNRGLFMQKMYSFSEEMHILNKVPETIVIKAEIMDFRADIFSDLNLSPSEQCFYLERIRYADGEIFNYTINYLPLRRFPDLQRYDFGQNSLYHILKTEYNIKPIWAKRSIQAQTASKSISEYLGIKENAPVIVLLSHSYDQYNQLVEISAEYMSGDSHRFDFEVSV